MKHDIKNREDIVELVNEFYSRVQEDELLSPVFSSRIKDEEWAAHLQRMYAFWNAILFSEKGFEGNPMQKHLSLPIEEKHFDSWLQLFRATVDELYIGPKANEAKQRASSIAQIINFKITSRCKC